MSNAKAAKIIESLPDEFDTKINEIFLMIDLKDSTPAKFVKVAIPLDELPEEFDSYDYMDAHGDALWRAKYGVPMPDSVEPMYVDTTLAGAHEYDGATTLTSAEWGAINDLTRWCGFTVDELWFVLEGLHWRPGQGLVDDKDPGWDAIRKQFSKRDPEGVVEVVRHYLCGGRCP
jgi:hypothetical protein